MIEHGSKPTADFILASTKPPQAERKAGRPLWTLPVHALAPSVAAPENTLESSPCKSAEPTSPDHSLIGDRLIHTAPDSPSILSPAIPAPRTRPLCGWLALL